MAIIAVTGGIAVGKSVFMEYWRTHFTEPVVDTDDIGRLLLDREDIKNELIQIFGSQVLDNNQNVDRHIVQKEIFSNQSKKNDLEALLHPMIRYEFQKKSKVYLAHHAYCVVIVPLLFETNTASSYDRVCLVESALDQRIRRCFDRGMSESLTLAVLHAQATSEQRVSISDDILYNVKDFNFFYTQIDKLHKQYQGLYVQR